MKIQIINNKNKIRLYCKKCLENHLYVKGYSFYEWFTSPELIETMVIATVKKKIIGVSVKIKGKTSEYGYNSGVYVKNTHRHRGIGTKLIRELAKRETLYTSSGNIGTNDFYMKCKKRGIFFKHDSWLDNEYN